MILGIVHYGQNRQNLSKKYFHIFIFLLRDWYSIWLNFHFWVTNLTKHLNIITYYILNWIIIFEITGSKRVSYFLTKLCRNGQSVLATFRNTIDQQYLCVRSSWNVICPESFSPNLSLHMTLWPELQNFVQKLYWIACQWKSFCNLNLCLLAYIWRFDAMESDLMELVGHKARYFLKENTSFLGKIC